MSQRDRRFEERLAGEGDSLLIPVLVAWLPSVRGGDRVASLGDLLSLSDPWHPPPRLQARIVRDEPDRCRIIAGEATPLSELRRRWREEGGIRDFGPYVLRQATLALDRAEWAVVGHRYKVPRLVIQQMSDIREFLQAAGLLGSGGTGTSPDDHPLYEDESAPLPDVALDEGQSAAPPVYEDVTHAHRPRPVLLSTLPVIDRLRIAMRGTREQRAVLIRDPNKLVAMAVLSSPKLSENEVEGFARMPVVAEDVLRVIASNRAWMRNYTILVALARNPKTPAAVALPLVPRLNERDLRALSMDRNVPEGLRITARKLVVAAESRRK